MSQSPEYYWLNSPSIIVDDSDPTIRYNGTWSIANETEIQSALILERTPIFNTLHVLRVFDGSFSYDFTGGGISVFATPYDDSNYTSQCFLDGNQLSFDLNATKAQFGQSRPVCQAFGLIDNIVHTIFVNVSVPPRQQQDTNGPLSGFAFDYMLIQPPLGMEPWDNGNQDVLLPVLDTSSIDKWTHPTLNFGIILNEAAWQIADVSCGWTFDAANGFHMTTPGSDFNVTFTGTRLWWYGYMEGLEGKTSSATFIIDGEAPSTFSVPSEPPFSGSQTFLFMTPVLQYATHQLTVSPRGGNGTYPLTVQSLIIQKSIPTILTPNSTVGSLPSSTTFKPLPSLQTPKRENLGGFVGGIVGGVVFLTFVVSAVCTIARRSKRRKGSVQTAAHIMVAPEPFLGSVGQTVRVFGPRKAQQGQQNIDNPFMQQVLQDPPLTKWTRRHNILDSAGRVLSSSTDLIQQQILLEPQNNNPSIQADPRAHPTSMVTIDESVTQIGDASRPTTPNFVIYASPSAAQGAGEVDGRLQ